MSERWPWMDYHADEAAERADLEREEYCARCDRLVPAVRAETCPACGEDER